MGIKKFAIGSRVASLVGVASAQAPAEAAATATITGQFKTSVGRALVLTTNGTTYYAKPGANGKFTVKMPASKVANSTVQMVDPSGKYLGPIILGTTKVKDIDEVWTNWEIIKKAEKEGTHRARPSALDGIPRHLPAQIGRAHV